MGGFNQGFDLGAQARARQQQFAQENLVAARDARAKLYENALNNPDINEGQRQNLLAGYTSLFAPHEAPTLIERLSGLIHGQAKQGAKTSAQVAQALQPATPPPAAPSASPSLVPASSPGISNGGSSSSTASAPVSSDANTTPDLTPAEVSGTSTPPPDSSITATPSSGYPASSDLPPSALSMTMGTLGVGATPTPSDTAAAAEPPLAPFQSGAHPFLQRLSAGINDIGQHLNAFAHPNQAANAAQAQDQGSLLAQTMVSPEALAERKLGVQAKTAIALQNARNAGQLAVANVRAGANPKVAYLSGFANDLGYDSYRELPQNLKDEADQDYVRSNLHPLTVTTPNPDGTFSKELVGAGPGSPVIASANTVAPRGYITTQSTNNTTDPLTGLTTTSRRTTRPIIPGVSTGPQSLPNVPGMMGQSNPPPVSSNAPATPASLNALASSMNSKRTSAATAPVSSKAPSGGNVPLDQTGHIPPTVGNKYVVEAANQLLDGADIKQLQGKIKEPAAALARQYGWFQGTYTPKEQNLLTEATTFLNQAAASPALDVLADPGSRFKLQRLIGAKPTSLTTLRSIPINIAADNLTPPEQEFLRTYNQLVGTVSGLGQLTRSGKMSEATVDRLIAELPNPYTTTSGVDARLRIQRLLNEANVAQNNSVAGQHRAALEAASTPTSSAAPGSAPARPAKVPEGYIHRSGPQGMGWYKP